ncbi:hydrogenase expression/formation protein [Thiolinea disciformis]|uniref:hydrogenase expression/formation protein n=1 Tax=Thiolinea disciformis TaxID=125614 RepID=UPI00036CE8EC|nr:hydrogenase expression/formation protein [Thiolinea disciformis]
MSEFQYKGRPLGIPIVGIGTQPIEEGDEQFNFTGSPGAMPTYHPPILPEPEEIENLVEAKALLRRLQEAMANYRAGRPALVFDLSHLDAANLDLVNQVLNEGEVSVVYEGSPRLHIQESVLTGIWRVRTYDAQQVLVSDVIEVGDIPSVVRDKTFANATPIDTDLEHLPQGIINSPSLITEIVEQSHAWQANTLAHVINLSLLPLSPDDLAFLGERLGVGEVTILSRGYGNCRIGSTQKRNVWWVKFYNSDDALILNTIEIIDVPEVARAAQEDLQDSALRLAEILEIYQ